MNFLKQTLFTVAICFILQYFLPWWTLVIGAGIGGYMFGNGGGMSFLSGLLGVGLLWLAMAMLIDVQTQSILTEKVAKIFPTKTPGLLFLVTAIIGGLPGGFAAMTGAMIKKAQQG
ncbi:MAG: hypothetical protein JNK10_00135 [Cyclobacteriaceae bacterium]|nr:hypothetical protein [Cyclobacteriaceae bacterium]